MAVLRTTEHEPTGERLEFWRDAVSRTFVPLDAMPALDDLDNRRFHGEIKAKDLADVQVSVVTASGHTVRRTKRLIGAAQDEYYQLALQVRGRCVVVQDGRTASLGPEDLMMLDTTRPYQLLFDGDHQVLSLLFPRRLMPLAPEDVAVLTATPLSGETGVGALIAPFLVRLAGQVHADGERPPPRLAGNVIDLLETLLVERLESTPRLPEAPQRVLLLRIRNDIESRLGSFDLTPDEIAAKHHISTRYLHKLFESQGVTVSQWIRQRRLERCRRDLRDPALAGNTVAAIGARWGLHDAAHFSRLFKAAFAMSPREYRLRHTGGALPRHQQV